MRTNRTHMAHWGAYTATADNGGVTITPLAGDDHPSPILGNIAGTLRHARIERPMVRAGWLEHGPGPSDRRGKEPFVPLEWPAAIDLLAGELRRVYGTFGPEAVHGGSYGWASAGRFHHAQSQLHRFLNCLGGFVDEWNSYSFGAAEVILPHVTGDFWGIVNRTTPWSILEEHTEAWLCFGGMPFKNLDVTPGGITRHESADYVRRLAARGVEFEVFSPIRDDLPDEIRATWHPVVPGTDVAVMLGIAHTLITEESHDQAFLDRYCTGFDVFERYVLGRDDGVPKTVEWAAALSGLDASVLRSLARRLPGKRVMVTTTWSLQRTEFGEQKPWMGVVLAAMLGQIGLPGGGYGFGYGSSHRVGMPFQPLGAPTFSQGTNPTSRYFPVARFADALLHPGEEYDYNGKRYIYPDLKLTYWAGGNPFHHHQQLPKLRRALARLDTIVVHEPHWTGMARHADIVIPSTLTLERNDIAGPPNDPHLVAMHQALPPFAEARNDFDVFAALAGALSVREAFDEGRDEMGWLRHIYDEWRGRVAEAGHRVADFDTFWSEGVIELPHVQQPEVYLGGFREDPSANPLRTPSGRIEIFSETIAGFRYEDAPGHPAWLEPEEWLGSPRAEQFPIVLLANNPATRLHSQLDGGAYSQASKVQGREPIRLNPDDAAIRGIAAGDVVRVYNDRGSMLAGAVISDALRRGVAQISTGAWYDPLDAEDEDSMCVHGNPNVLTADRGTSRLAQSSVGAQVLVAIERWEGEVPPIRAFEAPAMER